MPAGSVSRLWRWPVKSMAGEEVRALRLDERGAGGDRTHAVLHEHKGEWRPLTAREAPWHAGLEAAYPFNLDARPGPRQPPYAIVTEPGGRHRWQWGDPQLRLALERDLGRPVRLQRDVAGMPDVPGQILLTTRATVRRALRASSARRSTSAASAPTSTSTSTRRPGPRRAGPARRSS